jgi:hypothetical protein
MYYTSLLLNNKLQLQVKSLIQSKAQSGQKLFFKQMQSFSIDKIYRKVKKIMNETHVYEHASAIKRYILICDM